MNRIARNPILTVKRAVTAVAALLLLMTNPLHAQVNANFTASVVSGCSPLTVTFTDLSTGNIHAWFWDFGNGNTSTFDDVIATYTTPGTYTVSLTVRDTLNGFSSTKTEVAYIRVYADPAANFSANQTAGCAPFNVNFTDLSTSADGAVSSWLWDFGDGNISNSPNPSHTYLTAGTYTVTLVVQDVNGCQNTFIRPSLVSVTEVADLDFTALPRTGCAAPLVVDFTSVVTPAGNYTYLWNFGDGVTSTDANPTHIYTLNGDYAVTLTITDINGCQEQLVKNNYVLINTPVAAFSALDTAICVGQPLQLLNSSIGSDGFAWTFGDGNTSTQQNPSHTYTIPGVYSISLTASNSAGCNDITGRTNYITVYPAPGAAFGSTDNTGCQSPMFVTFNDQSAGNIIAWDWNFGNGDFSNGPSPTTTYTIPGSYDVSLTVTTADGCQATEVIPNYILFSEPDAEFALSMNQGCVPLTVSFADLSSSQADPIVSWLWNFGDGNISLLPNPVNVYMIPGRYTVTLTVITQSGCRNTEIFQYVEAGTRPNVNFTATPRVACVNQDIRFTDLSIGGATRWFWGFGDGTGSTQQNPTHAYVDTGYFSVSLIVEYLGCRDTLVIDSLVRIVGPLADFQMTPAAGCNPPLPVSFFDQSAGATSWFWDFGNGTTSTLQNPSQIFASTGTFEINLVVTDSITGCVNTVNQPLNITDPQAGFSVSDQRGCAPLTVNFANSSVQASNFFWDFGDGALSTNPNPSHDYLTSGTYTVQLIATDGTCSDTLVMQNVIRVIGPQPDFSVNRFSGCAPLPVRFTDLTVADPLAPIVNWIWDFGDGNTGSGPGPNHTYTAAGSYPVSLTVLDAEGCINTIQKLSYVSPTQPAAAFSTSDSLACPGSLVRFTNLSTGVGLSYFWNFGDGTTSTVPNPIKLFAPNASYTITLTVTDVNGCTDTEIKVNYVTVAQPIAAFAADVTSATCPPLSVNFTDQSSPNVVSWYWDFGDGSTSTLRNPSKVYAVAGQYDVMLIVTTALNCRDTMRMDNLINISGPTGSFSLAPNTGCEPLTVAFTANSPNPLWTYNWDFGDGTGATGTNVNHTYVQDTTVNPLLLIRDAGGCIVAIQSPSSIVIRPQPNPSFVANRNEVCLGQSVRFSNTSTSGRTITGYIWNFGDGSTSALVNPTHVYTDTGFYTVTLTAFTVDGCSSTSTTPVTIHVTGLPTAFFVVTPSEECVPANMVFTDASTSSYPLTNWQWDFGDGGIATGQTILPHTYLTAGVFNATLTVTDNRGCTGAATRSVRVNPLPTVNFTSTRYGCAPITISFSDQSAGSSPVLAWEWNFGDGTSSTLRNPVKTYASDGNYSITLTVTDSKGCRNSLTRVNYIQLERPIANFTSNARTTCPPQRVRFTDQSIPDTTITWLWNFGDGNTSTQQNPTYSYSDPGIYTVTLIVTNIFGCSDTFVRPNHVRVQQPPLAAFTVSDSSNCVPENIVFTSTSVPLGAPISTYQWNFGTGSGASGPAASFLYTVAGNYTSRLIVRDANGCRDTAYKTIYIHPNPVANFIAGDTVGCSVANISFTDLTTGVNAPVTWDWTFGDGQVGSSQNPVNTYFNDGVYDVKLVVTDINGCTDSITRNNYITLDHPSADFRTSRLTACPGTTVFFTDQSTGPFPAVNWYWNFGDGSPAGNQQNPTHIYTVPGTYSVSLIVTDAIGCRDTLVRSLLVEVYVPPTSNFSYGPTQGCDPLTVTFTNGSSSGTAAIVNYLWNFGDGGTSVVPNPSYVYNTPGNYTVRLTVTDANGCSAVRQQNVQVLQVPNVNFIADRRYSCAPQIINFTDLTTTPYVKVSWLWSFGDGNTSTSPAPSHAYLADGTYTVKLVVTDQNGCKDSVTKANYIRLSHPVANFSMDNASVCPNVPVGVRFADLSVPDTTLMSWLWNFGDGTTSTLQNPTHSYATPGNYSITLTVTNVLGCSDSYTLGNAINVLDPPVTNFAKSDSANCTPLSISFTDLSTPGESAIVGWNWTFGNGATSLQRNPTYTWTTPGIYTVTLTTTDFNGCQTSRSTQVRAYALPVARFVSDDTLGCSPQTVTFINQSTAAFAIASRKWYFGDGDSAINLISPTHTYQNDGVYSVTLMLQDVNGCRDTLVRPNYVRLSHPVADFSVSQANVCPGIPVGVTFTDQSVPDTTIASWLWQFGDGSTSTLRNPSHSYATPGTYTVILTITNVLGCTSSDTLAGAIQVLNPPDAQFTLSDNADCVPLTVALSDASVAGAAPIVAWNWSFGNGTTSLVQSPTYTWTTPGIYSVRLVVQDANGCMDSLRRSVQAYQVPVANFVASDTFGCAPETITFQDISSGAYAINSWFWSFGDGGTSTLRNPTHTYAADGTYTVSLTVTDVNGCSHTRTRSQYIRLTHPVANFTYNRTTACPGTTFLFSDASTPDHPLSNWLWDFGDGGTSTQQNPSYVYHTPGTYTVTLTIRNIYGCQDTEVKTALITIFTPPTAQTLPAAPQGCVPLVVDFIDGSVAGSAGLSSWTWNFGNGNSSAGFNPLPQTYATSGSYTTRLIVADANGCRDTVNTPVVAHPLPVAAFTANQTLSCAPVAVRFTDLSTGTSPATSWLWNFGDGSTSIQRDPVHTYVSNGSYTVTLIVGDVNGCKDTLVKPSYIRLNPPVANFTAGTLAGCTGTAVQFSDISLSDTTLTGWLWNFGDGSTSTLQNPQYTYSAAGIYDVTLIITNATGCRDTLVRSNYINIYTAPTAAFTPSSPNGCSPLPISFSNTSVGNSGVIVSQLWNFGDGNTSTQATPSHTYLNPGTYTVTLTVTDANGCIGTTSQTIRVYALPNASFFTNSNQGCAGTAIQFVNTSTGPNGLATYKWYFGDGDSSSAAAPSHFYDIPGTYSVTLIVFDPNGCSDTLVRSNYIRLRHPVADFVSGSTDICPGDLVVFNDRSVGDTSIVAWNWTFGNGQTSTQQNPSVVYSQSGTYSVSLIVTNALGCRDTLLRSNLIEVATRPAAQFVVSDPEGCTPFSVSMTNTSAAATWPIAGYQWAFGNGLSSNLPNPAVTYTAAGSYQIMLIATDQNGCRDTAVQTVRSLTLPQSNFVSNDRVGCAPEAVDFLSTATGNYAITGYQWNFGDGNTSPLQFPTHIYQNDGTYTVSLTVTDINGCVDTEVKPQYVRMRHPVANFTFSQSSICPGTAISFQDASTPDTTLANWTWNFGDGTSSVLQNPQHTYTVPGSYTVTLTVRNVLGCEDVEVKTTIITVQQAPTTQFTPSAAAGCSPLRVNFTNTTVINSAQVVSWLWNFGNGVTSSLVNPAYTFVTPGTYAVTLTATDAVGCATTYTQNIVVYPLPVAGFATSDSVGCSPETVTFFSQTGGVNVISGWQWTFGDGGTANTPVPVHTYANDGVYDVQLIVTDINGCRDTLAKPNYIRLNHPVANFLVDDDEICPGTQVQFSDNSEPDTTLVSWFWTFGDGSTSNQPNPVHIYSTPGTYTVTLRVTNVLGCSDEEIKTQFIEVLNLPTPAFSMSDTTGCPPMLVNFRDLSSGNPSPVASWSWNLGNGLTSSVRNPSAYYPNPGVYPVTLTITDFKGCVSTRTQTVTVINPPQAAFTASDTVGCEEFIRFFDLSTSSNNLIAWQWFFGDGGSSTLRNPVHTYLNTGTYTVTLIVFDAFGCSDTLTKTDFIDLTRPQAAFAQDLDVICPGSPLQFVDLTVADYPISAWLWNFGDGSTSNQQNPVHTYAQPGTYTVTLTVTNILGCTDSETGSVEVLPPPVAAFTATPNEGCMPLTVAFDENAVGISSAVIFWQWDFGDGSGSNVPNPVYTYEEPGTYTVTLTVLDGNGCGKDTSMTIQVLPLPLANFSAVNNIGCAPQQVQFTSLAGGAYPIAGWLWKFGDGSTSALQNPAHTYAADGLYTVTLIVTDINGCTDSLVRPQYVRLRHPDANFTWTPSAGCPPLNVSFRDATLSDTSIVAWAWNFGDGATSTQQNVSHLYASPGVYTVTLTVTDINGCTNTEVKTNIIRAYTPPVAVWQPGDTSGCTPFALNFYNNSVAGSAPITAYAWNFGNGNNSALPNPTQTFVTPGNYPVRLIVTDANGCRDTAIHTIFSRPLPTPDFNASDRVGCAPQQVFFSDQSINGSPVAAWLWNFGDGNTSSQQFPTHMYQNDGVYTVSLTLTDIYGCQGTVTRPQYIRLRRPQPDFSASQTVVCPGTAVQFTDLTLADTTLTDWLWQFSDGSLATQQNPVKVFSVPGFYSVTLTVHNLLDCGAAITKTSYIEVRQRPDADFVPNVNNGCAPLAVQFTNTTNSTSAPVASWFWDFANGSTSIFTNPSQTFVQPGTYPVRLVATDGFGCRDTVRKNIVVYRPPTANFIASDSVGCSPETISFLDQSVQGNAPISSWFWSFGDGGAAGQQFPSHTYNADGEYNVRLIVADLNGCRDTLLRPEYIRLSHPVADFVTSVTRTCPEAIVTFADASIPDTTLVSWQWNFGDGSTSTLQNPTHTYANGGTYAITLTVTNLLGCSHTISRPNVIQVYTQPVTLFTPSSLEGCTPFEVDFTDNSSGVSAPIVSWLWNFGDGSTSTAQNPTHTYMAPGLYTITLTTTDNNGCTSSHSRQVRGLTLPIANFMSLDTLGCAPETVHFTDLTQGDYPIVAWSWNFGDGNSSNAQFPTHTYAQQGLYDIRLIATDANGCRDTLIRRQYIRLRNPDANFSWSPSLGCPGMEVQFTDRSIPDTTLVNWQWNFGDGTGSVVVNPRHVYELPGTYTVSLTVTNVLGCSETQTYAQIITVATPPIAGFLVNDTLGCTPFTPGLTDNSQGIGAPVTQWQWSFGNGDSSALQEPVYTYPTPGTFTMTLVITDNNGCKDTASQVVASTRSPVANFMSRDTVGCAPKLVRFRDLSSGDYPITYWNWSFGNGFSSPQQNAAHTYLNDGVYTVRLIVGDDNGCLDTLIRRRYIRLSHPDADFSAADRNGCVGTAVSFQDRSIQDTTIVAWRWDFGDGTFSVQQNPVHVYDQPGEYDVRLVVTNINGCSDTLLQTNYVDIFTPPTASFVATDTSGCVPFLVDFTDFSSSPYGLAGWEWFLNGAPKGNSQNISHYFVAVGDYEVVLVITDANGCKDTLSQMVHVHPVPEADFVASDTLGCAPAVISFTDRTMHIPNRWLWEFGDGSTSVLQNPVYTYQEDGIYNVKLTVTDRYGCSDEIEKINYIRLDHPEVDFNVEYVASCPPVRAVFRATGAGLTGIARWQWNMGDGTIITTLVDTLVYAYDRSGDYTVTLIGIDSLGCTGTDTLDEQVNVLGDIVPAPVQIHAVSVLSNNQIEVKFAPHAGTDFDFYTVYRETPGQGYVAIDTLYYINDTLLIDITPQANVRSYCYKVTTTNHCGSESSLGLTDPHCSINATAMPVPGQIVVSWNPYRGWNEVSQYEVYEVTSYNPLRVTFLAVVPGNVTRYVEPFDDCFNDRGYRIKATGLTPLQVSWSDTTQAVNTAGIRGNATDVVRATVENNKDVLVEWKNFELPGVSVIYLDRAIDGGPFNTLATMPVGEEKFRDRDVEVGLSSYSYRVYAQDSCGNYSPMSNVGKSVLLNADKDVNTTLLSWTPYEDWRFGVDEYRIEIMNDTTGRWEMVDIVQGNVDEYRDTKTTLDQPEYCYRVWAVELGGNETVSLSNEVCLEVETSIHAPTAFTPNQDGVNEVFLLSGFHVQNYNLKIYSRWGMLLFETNDINQGWDGTFRGGQVNEGVYVYIAKGIGYNGQPFLKKGSVSLLR